MIPNPAIYLDAFLTCDALTTVNLPKAVTIGQGTFYSCNALTTINLPEAITINSSTFNSCTALTTVNLPKAVTINSSAFYNCTALETINLPASLITINGNPFVGCTNLATITVATNNPNYRAEDGKLLSKDGKTLVGWPTAAGNVTLNGITTIGDEAFRGCTALTAVTLPGAVTIGDYAFSGCTALTTVNLPEAVTIGQNAFGGCTALTSVNLPVATSVGNYAFWYTGTEKALTVTLGDTPPELGTNMFVGVPNTYASETGTKSVTVKVPDNAAWSGIIGTYSGSDTTPNWGNAFRGGGWNGTGMMDSSTVNENISLTIEALP